MGSLYVCQVLFGKDKEDVLKIAKDDSPAKIKQVETEIKVFELANGVPSVNAIIEEYGSTSFCLSLNLKRNNSI